MADEIPATLTIINSFSTPPSAEAYTPGSYRELLDNKRLYDDLGGAEGSNLETELCTTWARSRDTSR